MIKSQSLCDLRESSSKQGALPPLVSDRKQKAKPLLPVMRNTKAYATQRQLAPDLRDFFAMACRRNNPHETSFHMEARIGFRRPKKYLRLRPLGDPPVAANEVAPWMKKSMAFASAGAAVQSTPDLRQTQEDDCSTHPDDEMHDLIVDIEEHERVAADAIGKVVREAYAFEASRLPLPR
mmetsp:Transcript_2369/g.4112  ORF Transcript_2369/g.4112 Transcript_2369/m.4112 type:complete len:179 (-) Transcript_2369:94-630(-)